MYKCQKCGKNTLPGEKCNKIITATRERTYINKFKDRKGKEIEKISTGTEIIKEISVCDKCLNNYNNR